MTNELADAAADQRGKADAGMGQEQSGRAQSDAASTPPIQIDHFAGAGNMIPDEAMIDDFIRLRSVGLAEKKALRVHLLAWEIYRVKREIAEAAA